MSNLDRLTRVTAKMRRGEEHFKALHRAMRRFVYSDNYTVTNYQHSGNELIVWGEALREPPRLQWGIRAGDAIHNWRSALDHLVWELSEMFSGPAPAFPLPLKSRWRDVTFPILLDPAKWTAAVKRSLWAVDPRLHADFKALQPFEARNRHSPPGLPEREPLAVLQELWNIDKHRRIHLTDLEITLHKAHLVVVETGAPVTYTFSAPPTPRPFKGKAELGRLRVAAQSIPLDRALEMDMEWELAYDIRFDPGAPCFGALLGDTLRTIKDSVNGVIVQFAPEFV